MTTIKITELSDIGANLTTSTLVPVVNMAGVPVTQKTNVGNIANLILEGAGVDYPEASVALLAQTVSNAAQPNITSVGTLTNITVSGNASINGNITSNGTAYVGNLSTTGLASITTLNVGTTANLGSVNNVIIEGGTDGQVLTTDGDGNLSWTSGATSYGDSNVVTLLSAFGSNTITTTGNVSIGNITATNLGNVSAINRDGSNSNVLYGNGVFAPVTGGNSSYGDSNVVSLMAAFGSNTITTTGNISGGNLVTGGQVVASGNVSSGTGLSTGGFLSVDGNTDLHNTIVTGNLSATGNITANNLGNISAINLTGSNSNVLYGNGVFAPVTGGNGTYDNSNVATFLAAFGSNTITTTGNVSVGNLSLAGNVILSASNTGELATSQLGGEGVGGISSVQWTTASELSIRTDNVSPFIATFESLKINDSFALLTGGGGAFPANVLVNGVVSQTTPVPGYIDFIIPVDDAPGSNVYVYTFNLTRSPVTEFIQLTGNTINLGNAVLTANGNALVVDSIQLTNGNIGTIGNISNINLTGSNSNVLYGNGVFAAVTVGNLSQISNGNSNVTLTDTNGNVYINTNGGTQKQWIFDTVGNLRTPGNVDIYGAINFPQQVSSLNWSTYNIELSQYGRITTNVDFFANANTIGAQYLKGDGSNISNIAGANISGFVPNANVANTAFAVAAANVSGLGNIATVNLDGNVSNLLTGNGTYVAIPTVPAVGNIATINLDGNSQTWLAGNGVFANIAIPSVGNIATINLDGSNTNVLYGNGVFAAVAGGNANTGNVTFDDNIVIGTGDEFGGDGLFLAPGNGSIANGAVQYLRVRGGDYPTHIHLDTGNNQYYDQYFGADGRYVKLEANGNVVINADDYLGNSATWTLDTTGNLTLAGGNSVIQSIANSSLDPTLPNVSTMVLTPDQGYNAQSLVLDPTAPGHIHLRAPGANIDEPSANIFLGGEDSSFEVGYYNGSAPNVFVHSGGNTWTFDIDGNITFPRDGSNISTDPYLKILGGPSPQILSEDASLAGPANLAIQSDYLNLSGSTGNRIAIYADNGEIGTEANMVLYTNLANPGNIVSWTLDTTGNLTLPGNLVIAGNTSVFGTNASLLQTTDDRPLLALSSGANGAVSSIWVEDVANVGTSNIAAVYANPTIGSGIVRIAVGQNGGNTGPNLWDFDTTGNLTLPTSGHIIVSGGIVGSGASPAPYISGFDSIGSLEFTNGNSNVTVTANATSWTFGTNGNLTLPEGGIVTNNIPPVTFDILYQYDDLEWDGITVTFTNASSTYMLGVLALMQAGDPITLVGPGGPISTTVAIPYTGGSAGYFTVTEANSPIQISQFTLPNRLTSVNGVTLTTNAKNYLFTEAGVTQSPVLTVDTLPSGQYAVAGFRAFVSDANLAPVGNFGEIVGNSGSNTVCVWCDGTNWRIG
jgi:hypothetical protein